MIRETLRVVFTVYLLFPFIFLFYQFGWGAQISWAELWWAFKNSFYQAFASAVGSLLLGLWVALGLLKFSSGARVRRFLEALCLTPNFLPPLFILLAVLSAVPSFPMGVSGIAIVHTLINFGLVAVMLARRMEEQMGRLVEVSFVLGASRLKTWSRIVLPLLKGDLLSLGLFVFIICFGSFSVPLIVGGGKGTTLEVLIYEKIRLSSEWSGAVMIAALQSLFIFSFAFILMQREKGQKKGIFEGPLHLKLIAAPSGLAVLLVLLAGLIAGYMKPFFSDFSGVIRFYQDIGGDLLPLLMGTLVISLMTGGLVFMALSFIAYLWPSYWFSRFLQSYLAPSTALACFAFLVVVPNGGAWPYFKIPITLLLLNITGLFRLSFRSTLEDLNRQYEIAWLMGAKPGQIFKAIYWPQVYFSIAALSALCAIWACGDYAVSRILAPRTLSLAMMTDTLMSGYRINQAVMLSGLVLVVGVLIFVGVLGGLYVLGQRLASSKR